MEDKNLQRLVDNRKVRYLAFNLFVFFISVYLFTASGFNFFQTDASRARYEVTKSIVERGDLSIPEGLGFKGVDGRDYSWYGLGQSLLMVPFYIIGKAIGTPENTVSMMNQVMGAAVVVILFLFAIALGYSKRASLLVSIFYGLGTMAWPLAKQPFDHTIETFFILFSVYCMYLYVTRGKILTLIFTGLSLGVAFVTRTTSILIAPSLFILMVSSTKQRAPFKTTVRTMTRDIVLFSIAFVPFLVLTLWYDNYRFGSLFETGATLLSKSTGIKLFEGTSFLNGLSGLLVSPGKGFFYYSPVAILFLFTIKDFLRKHHGIGIAFVVIILSYIIFFSKYLFWHGDWAWGPRYLLVITPFLMLPLCELFDSSQWIKKPLLRSIVYALFIISLAVQISAVSVDFNKYLLRLRFIENIPFTIIQSPGMQPTVVPPPEIYFDWERSPLVAQFTYLGEIFNNIGNYEYTEMTKEATVQEMIRTSPLCNVYDFWWLYKYFINKLS